MNLPDVGRNLTDHPRWSLVWSVNDTSTTEMYWRNNTLQADALAEWSANRTGYIASTVLNHIGFSRVGEDLLEKEPCAGNLTAHYELIFAVSQVPRGHINRCLTASSSPERNFREHDPGNWELSYYNGCSVMPALSYVPNTFSFFLKLRTSKQAEASPSIAPILSTPH